MEAGVRLSPVLYPPEADGAAAALRRAAPPAVLGGGAGTAPPLPVQRLGAPLSRAPLEGATVLGRSCNSLICEFKIFIYC